MTRFAKSLYRNRRRALVTTVFSLISGAALAPTHIPLILIAFSVPYALVLLAIGYIFPKQRGMAENFSVGAAIAFSLTAFTDLPSDIEMVIFIVITAVIHLLYTVPVLDRWTTIRNIRVRGSGRINHSPAQVWPYLMDTPDTPKDQWQPNVLEMEWIERPHSFRYVTRLGDVGKVEQIHTILRSEPYRFLELSSQFVDADPKDKPKSGTIQVTLSPVADTTVVTFDMTEEAMPLRIQLQFWVDDTLGRRIDTLEGLIAEGRKTPPTEAGGTNA